MLVNRTSFRSWHWFSGTIRKVSAGAILVTELLDSVLNDNSDLIDEIMLEHESCHDKLCQLVICAKALSVSLAGRIEVRRLADFYRTEAMWPTDDVSLRRAYEVYRNGRLGDCLPQIDDLVSRLA